MCGTAPSISPWANKLLAVISSEDGEVSTNEISEENTFPIKVGLEITVHVKGDQLAAGEHTIDISLATKEVGDLAFDVTDSI